MGSLARTLATVSPRLILILLALLPGGFLVAADQADAKSGKAAAGADVASGVPTTREQAQEIFTKHVKPFLETYCSKCHGENKSKGDFTYRYAIKSAGSPAFRPLWKHASASVKATDMPPEKEDKQPSAAERQTFINWVEGMKYLSPKDPGQFVIRRLNKVEYGNTLQDLFGVDPSVAAILPDEVFGAGYSNSLSPLLVEQYLLVANNVLDQVFAPAGKPVTAAEQRILNVKPGAGVDERAAAERIAKDLARRAYRRPVSAAELDVLLNAFDLGKRHGRDFRESMRLVVKAVLVSPQFLFITPVVGEESKPGVVTLDDHQLASRLSYFLWATMPDGELMKLADEGRLRDPAVLATQARRLLSDPRSRALFDGFGAQWLGIDKLAGKTFDPQKFPEMTPGLRQAMYDEARLLFDSIVREDRSVRTFIEADYTFADPQLGALFYGMKIDGEGMRRVALNDPNRGGILAMPGVLATTSFPNRTSPVNRGVWVLEHVLGEHVPPAPANVPALEKQDQTKVATLTLRQRTELHRSDPVCNNCHKILDPIGFGLERFDAIGRWRDRDESGGPIDSSGELPGEKRFSTPKELKKIIGDRLDDLCHSLTGRMLAYALCRQLEGYDEIVVDGLAADIAKDGHRMQRLVVAVVTSYPFTHRRIGELPGEANGKK
jgi:mono/diheme cytochrome c family protein